VEVQLLPESGPWVPDRQHAHALSDEIERGLRRLSIEQRSVLVVTYYLDLPLAEAAATLRIPLGTMKSRLNRALEALRASLEADARTPAMTAERPA
jgi:RNA polymerase sigma-70 factor (ECF subfamily)